MFNLDNLQNYIDDALGTWHGSLEDPMNAGMKFFGENGELIDYLAKAMFKPNFKIDDEHIIAEAGDAWYYFRILASMFDLTIDKYNELLEETEKVSHNSNLALMGISSGSIFSVCSMDSPQDIKTNKESVQLFLILWLNSFLRWLDETDINFDYMHNYNVNKLSGSTNHGWKSDEPDTKKNTG